MTPPTPTCPASPSRLPTLIVRISTCGRAESRRGDLVRVLSLVRAHAEALCAGLDRDATFPALDRSLCDRRTARPTRPSLICRHWPV